MEKKNSTEKSSSSTVNKDIKEGWGSNSKFNASYGLKPTTDGYDEGKAIKDAMKEAGKQAKKEGGSK